MDLRVEFNDHLNFSDPEGTEEIEQQPQAQFLNNGETAEQQKLHLEREIPSDHWAYNAMGYLVSRGILPAVFEGFFDGSRTLTCYEMQQMTSILGMVIQTEGLEDVSGEGGQVFQVMFQTLRAEFSD